MGWVHSSVTL